MKNSNSFPRLDTIIICVCQGEREPVRVVDGFDEGETGWALFCHSLGSEKGWNKQVFLKERR